MPASFMQGRVRHLGRTHANGHGGPSCARPFRRGSAASSLILSILSFSVLTVVAVVFTPKYLSAGEAVGNERHARDTSHQMVIEGLASLVSGAEGIIALHERGPSPFVELVLWLEDSTNRGVIDRHEIVVIGHSRVLRTVTVYQTARQSAALAVVTWQPDDKVLRSRTFCDQWRADAGVRPRVIGTGISDMQFERIDQTDEASARYAITLTWAEDSVDGADEATLIVDAAVHSISAQE
jgi:hypothetical protein